MRTSVRKLVRFAIVAGMVFLLAACAKEAPQSALDPAGPIARKQHQLFLPVFWIAAAIFFIVEGLILFAVIKFRDRPGREEPKQIHGNSKLEFTWTMIPALILLGVAVPTVLTIFDLAEPPAPNALKVKVVGHQWWWEYQYGDLDPEVVTANELVIPTDREVFLELESADVIHSFWVPRLAGKQDVVPGRTNTMRIIADEPGTYLGQCAEFCAIAHAYMRLRVVALEPAAFDGWVRGQQQDAAEPTSGDAAEGKELFMSNACVRCHTIDGTEAQGQQGPDLTHFASRETLGSAIVETTPETLFNWIKNARKMKAGVIMPPFEGVLTDEQIRKITAYLLTLK